MLVHLAVANDHFRFRNDSAHTIRNLVNIKHTIMHKIDLSIAIQFAQDGRTKQGIIPTNNPRFDR